MNEIAIYLSDLMGGGTEWFALRLARGLSAEGLKPVFVVIRKEGDLLPTVAKEFDIFSLDGHEYNLKNLIRAVPALVRFLKKHRPRILVCNLPLVNITAGVAVLIARTKTRLMFVEHMIVSQTLIKRSWGGRFLTKLGLRFIYPMADMVVAVSNAAANDLATLTNIPEQEIKVIYNPIIPDDLPALCQETPDHPWLQNHSVPVIFSIGRLLPVKNFDVLIRAFNEAKKHKPLKLIIIGEGDERPRLQELVRSLNLEDCVDLAGFKDNVFSYLTAADLFILPSSTEAFGNVIAEALACGIPVVSTDCGGVREVLGNGEYGDLVPVGNAEQMSSAILRNLSKEHDRLKLKEQGMRFSTRSCVHKYKEIFDGWLNGKR